MEQSQITAAKEKKKQNNRVLPDAKLSFTPFTSYLEKMSSQVNGLKRQYLEEVILQCDATCNDAVLVLPDIKLCHNEIFALVDQTLANSLNDFDGTFAIYTSPCGADLLYNGAEIPRVLNGREEKELFIQYIEQYLSDERELLTRLSYAAIWNHYTNSPSLLRREEIIPFKSNAKGQQTYFQLNADFRFITITSKITDTDCSKLIDEIEAAGMQADEILQQLKAKLPLQKFCFSGFWRIEITDVTVSHIVKLITRQVVASNQQATDYSYMKDVREALTEVAGRTNLQFGLLPLLHLNNKSMFSEHFSGSASFDNLKGLRRSGLFDYLMNVYRHKPHRIYLKSITDELALEYDYLRHLRDYGMQSFALLPVYYHEEFAGVLEVFTDNEHDLDSIILTSLEAFLPVLSVIFKKSIETFDQTINEVIKNKFTALQPSVQWRFNEAAWNYLQAPEGAAGTGEIEDIEFNQVYPIYGAIDVKNSTVNRNNALREDLSYRLQLLKQTLLDIQAETSFAFCLKNYSTASGGRSSLTTKPG